MLPPHRHDPRRFSHQPIKHLVQANGSGEELIVRGQPTFLPAAAGRLPAELRWTSWIAQVRRRTLALGHRRCELTAEIGPPSDRLPNRSIGRCSDEFNLETR